LLSRAALYIAEAAHRLNIEWALVVAMVIIECGSSTIDAHECGGVLNLTALLSQGDGVRCRFAEWLDSVTAVGAALPEFADAAPDETYGTLECVKT
jgi:hypothetical protein